MLTGAGDQAFCAGGDLKEMADTSLQVPPPDFLPQFGRNIEVAKPTIAAVNGVAYAGGFLLAQNCDLCVAAESARFAITEVKVGRGSPWAAYLSWLVPPRIALQILLTGDPLSAARAREVGLVNEVVPDAGLRAYVQAMAERHRGQRAAVGPGRQADRLPVGAAAAGAGVRGGRADLGAGLPQPGRAGGAGRVPRQAPPGVDRPLMAADIAALLRDLAAESAVLEAIVAPLPQADWARATPAAGWNIADQVGHLAYFDEAALQSVTDAGPVPRGGGGPGRGRRQLPGPGRGEVPPPEPAPSCGTGSRPRGRPC